MKGEHEEWSKELAVLLPHQRGAVLCKIFRHILERQQVGGVVIGAHRNDALDAAFMEVFNFGKFDREYNTPAEHREIAASLQVVRDLYSGAAEWFSSGAYGLFGKHFEALPIEARRTFSEDQVKFSETIRNNIKVMDGLIAKAKKWSEA